MSPTSVRPARTEVQVRTPDDVLHLQWTHAVVARDWAPRQPTVNCVWEIVHAVTSALDLEALLLNALRVQVRYRLAAAGLPTQAVDGACPADELICQALNDPAGSLALYPLRSWAAAS
ncbi:hypothetical protein [Kribbella sp. DT2]|uniref:hypothetical protein n=1 Tax=Kribbella sp. DT2 TaxID=3393427 RepID=UPI003CF7BD94